MRPFLPPPTAFKQHTADQMRLLRDQGFPFETYWSWINQNIDVLLTGVWPEGHRQKVGGQYESYTHIALIDPGIDIRDFYQGEGNGNPGLMYDQLAIPAGQGANANDLILAGTGNIWQVMFHFQYFWPGLGRKRVLCLDRNNAGTWPGIM
jgi:hypothetical protein